MKFVDKRNYCESPYVVYGNITYSADMNHLLWKSTCTHTTNARLFQNITEKNERKISLPPIGDVKPHGKYCGFQRKIINKIFGAMSLWFKWKNWNFNKKNANEYGNINMAAMKPYFFYLHIATEQRNWLYFTQNYMKKKHFFSKNHKITRDLDDN